MIYLIRHGEASAGWGHADDPGLSERGHHQAEAVARSLEAETVGQIVASPMARCQQTALPYAALSGLNVTTDPSVSEIPTPEDLSDRVAWLRGFMSGNWDEALPLLHDWRTRLIDAVTALPDETAVFTHFIAINAIAGHLQGSREVTAFRPGHCSVTRLSKSPAGLRLESLGSEAATQIL